MKRRYNIEFDNNWYITVTIDKKTPAETSTALIDTMPLLVDFANKERTVVKKTKLPHTLKNGTKVESISFYEWSLSDFDVTVA